MKSRFAAFWASALVILGLLLVVLGIGFAGIAVTLDMPWGSITGQAVMERTVAAIALVVSGLLAGGPFIVLGALLRVALDLRRAIVAERRLVRRIARRLEARDAERLAASTAAGGTLAERLRQR